MFQHIQAPDPGTYIDPVYNDLVPVYSDLDTIYNDLDPVYIDVDPMYSVTMFQYILSSSVRSMHSP